MYTSAAKRNLISLSLSFRLQKKEKKVGNHKKREGRGEKIRGERKFPIVSIAHITAFKCSVRKWCVNTTGLLCGFPSKPLP